MTTARRVLLLLAALAVTSSCSSGGGDQGRGQRRTTADERRNAAAGGPDADAPDAEALPAETGPTSVFSGVTTAPPVPAAEFEVSLTGTVTARAAGPARTRCIEGAGYFDVEVTPDTPLPAGAVAITSVVFDAPGFRGPGRYDAGRVAGAEWSVALVDVDNGAPSEYYSPRQGPQGAVTVDEDGRSGRFEIRGLVDDEGNTLSASGRFVCGTVER